MKTHSLFIAFVAVAITLFISSCSLMQKEEFAQRKYYDFPRSKHTVEATQTGHIAPKPIESKSEDMVAAAKSEKTVPAESVSASITPVLTAEHKNLPVPARKNKKQAAQSVSPAGENNTDPSVEFVNLPGVEKTTKKSFPLSNSDSAMILMVLAAIFIPPLGVYLKQGVSQWFWITFILCLLSLVGIGFAPLFGLWLVAAVIALLVVFDAI